MWCLWWMGRSAHLEWPDEQDEEWSTSKYRRFQLGCPKNSECKTAKVSCDLNPQIESKLSRDNLDSIGGFKLRDTFAFRIFWTTNLKSTVWSVGLVNFPKKLGMEPNHGMDPEMNTDWLTPHVHLVWDRGTSLESHSPHLVIFLCPWSAGEGGGNTLTAVQYLLHRRYYRPSFTAMGPVAMANPHLQVCYPDSISSVEVTAHGLQQILTDSRLTELQKVSIRTTSWPTH